MKTDFLLAITQLAAERNLPREVVFSAVEAALVTAFKKDEIGAQQNISVKIHPVTGDVKVYTAKVIAKEVKDVNQEISLTEARKYRKDAQIGESLVLETTSFHAGRIAAQTAKQVVLQRLREAEREFIFGEFSDREGDIISGIVQRIEPRQVIIDLGKAEGVLPGSEQVRTERYRPGQRLKLFLLEVNRTNKGPRLIMSRSHPNLVRRLFELEVPEIFSGIVEVKAVAREAGYRSKVAVVAKQEGLDAVGSCVGLRGVRIQNVVNELNGERIDVIQWHPAPKAFIANALSPAQVVSVDTNEENTAIVVVPDNQLSLAIGKEGQNARLAARITGWRIDIKSASAYEAEKAAAVKEKAVAAAATRGLPEGKAVEEKEPAPVESLSLESIGIGTRAVTLLRHAGVSTVNQLAEKSEQDLMGIKGFGQKALEEVRSCLQKTGLSLATPRTESVPVETAPVQEEPAMAAEAVVTEEAIEALPGLEEEVEEELIEEIVPYEPVVEEVAEKATLRFAEDIFGPRMAKAEGKKKGKKKSRDEKTEEVKARKAHKVHVLATKDEFGEELFE
ncbi:MAG: transcription termination/antitermination protein NusA [Dehalococcoidia bacterium]|nr:transcription termination/antitermination protein NusA [Dehalococcoidia bacterium]